MNGLHDSVNWNNQKPGIFSKVSKVMMMLMIYFGFMCLKACYFFSVQALFGSFITIMMDG